MTWEDLRRAWRPGWPEEHYKVMKVVGLDFETLELLALNFEDLEVVVLKVQCVFRSHHFQFKSHHF